MEELCPDVMFLNYTNPMAMNMLGVFRGYAGSGPSVCATACRHGARPGARHRHAVDEINYVCAGINHMAFYLRFERDGQDLYPLVRKVVEEGRVPDWNRVRYELFTRLGLLCHRVERAPRASTRRCSSSATAPT